MRSSTNSSFPFLDTQRGYFKFWVCLFPEILFPVVCVLQCAVFLYSLQSIVILAPAILFSGQWPLSGAVCWVSAEGLALVGVYFRGGPSGRAPDIA